MQISTQLDARCVAALVEVFEPLNSEAATDLAFDAFEFARNEGYFSAKTGASQMPILFQGNKLLEQGWHDGFKDAETQEEMEHCPGCQNDSGDPCHCHG